MNSEAGGSIAAEDGSSVVGIGLPGAEFIAERLRVPGEFVFFICVFDGVDMIALFLCL